MAEALDSHNSVLGRQSDPEPAPQGIGREPSLALYAVLSLLAIFLLVPAFRSGKADWPGLCFNLAIEIAGALIILIVVDRRLRAQDVRLIKGLPAAAQLFTSAILRTQTWQVQTYARIFYSRLETAVLPHYLPPLRLENEVTGHLAKGFILYGPPGIGKTTFLLHMARNICAGAAANPQSSLVPVFLPARQWLGGGLTNALLQSVRQYFFFREESFQMLLRSGRIIAICDGIDEAPPAVRPALIDGLTKFQRSFPKSRLVVSSRTYYLDLLDSLGMPKLEVPALSEDEVRKLLELRNLRPLEGA